MCSFMCLDEYVWDGKNCINDTNVTKVSVKMTTKLELNNTVEDICSNLDTIALAVINTLEEIFGIPFSGAVSEVNNKTTKSVCIYNHNNMNNNTNNNNTNNSNEIKNNSINANRRRLLLLSSATSSSTATVTSISNEKTTLNNADTQTNSNILTVYAMIKEKLVETDKLNLVASNTFTTDESTQQPDSSSSINDELSNLLIIVGCVAGGLVTIIAAVIIICCICCCKNHSHSYTPMDHLSDPALLSMRRA